MKKEIFLRILGFEFCAEFIDIIWGKNRMRFCGSSGMWAPFRTILQGILLFLWIWMGFVIFSFFPVTMKLDNFWPFVDLWHMLTYSMVLMVA